MTDPSRFSDPWRMRCPDGHTDIIRRAGGSPLGPDTDDGTAWYYCGTCEQRHAYIIDMKTDEKVYA